MAPAHSSHRRRRSGVHFVALDNVSRAKPEVGPEQLAWLKKDLARFPKTAPIVVFTHRPLFDLKPEWEWFTSWIEDSEFLSIREAEKQVLRYVRHSPHSAQRL